MNRGEWSEFYAFLKLLADGEIYGADGKLNKVPTWRYPVKSITRERVAGDSLKFVVCKDLGLVRIEAPSLDVQQEEFGLVAIKLLEAIKARDDVNIEEFLPFIEKIHSPKIKAKSKEKRDISIVLHDVNVGRDLDFGFSIKSMLGGKSTLFNAAKSSKFKYQVIGYDQLSAAERNESKALDLRDRVTYLLDKKCSFQFLGIDDVRFKNNLQMVDSRLDEILSYLVLEYYSQDYMKERKVSKGSAVKSLVSILEKMDPLTYQAKNQLFYEYKIKQFMTACALGLTAVKPWTGKYDASGGYLIVKKDGTLVCCHLYNWNAFQDYLFNYTALDTPSTTRFDFGDVYKDKNIFCIDLNFIIKFNLSAKGD